MISIAVDAMGGDHGPSVIVPAVIESLISYSDIQIHLYGKQPEMEAVLATIQNKANPVLSRLHLHHAEQVVEMDDAPALAMRNKRNSSMRLALNAVKSGQAQGCVSAGNTGALMATARFVLKTLPGIDRPALIYSIPVLKLFAEEQVHILDLGANIECTVDHLFQFAVMGSAFATVKSSLAKPRVSLLNIGSEDIKGTESIRECAKLLGDSDLIHYTGYIEGHQLYDGLTDVVVCDGFSGNVLLKVTEGVSKKLINMMKDAFMTTFLGKLGAFIARSALKPVQVKFNPALYNGASFLGLNGIVLKSHGNATVEGFAVAIKQARIEAMHSLPTLIRESISQTLTLKG